MPRDLPLFGAGPAGLAYANGGGPSGGHAVNIVRSISEIGGSVSILAKTIPGKEEFHETYPTIIPDDRSALILTCG